MKQSRVNITSDSGNLTVWICGWSDNYQIQTAVEKSLNNSTATELFKDVFSYMGYIVNGDGLHER
jgi:hypothetical protein